MKLGNIAEVIISSMLIDKSVIDNTSYLSTTSLSVDNEILDIKVENRIVKQEKYRLQTYDIVLKRMMAQYVNCINNINDDIYAGNNLIIIRANDCINSNYLACILEQNLDTLNISTSGAYVMPRLGAKDLNEFDIGELPSYEIQSKIGELWLLSKEKGRLEKRKQLLQTQLIKAQLLQLTKQFGGINK